MMISKEEQWNTRKNFTRTPTLLPSNSWTIRVWFRLLADHAFPLKLANKISLVYITLLCIVRYRSQVVTILNKFKFEKKKTFLNVCAACLILEHLWDLVGCLYTWRTTMKGSWRFSTKLAFVGREEGALWRRAFRCRKNFLLKKRL